MSFPTTVGIEYSYIGTNPLVDFNPIVSKLEKKLPDVYNDECVEIPSPVHKSYNEVKDFYQKMKKQIKKHPLISHRDGEMSGGGHIHVGLSHIENLSFKKRIILNVITDVTNRPYLNWIFNEWCDDLNAISYAYDGNFINLIKDRTFKFWPDPGVYNCNNVPKKYAVIYRQLFDTIEFRFFDAKRNYHEVKDHIDFVLKYYEYILNLTRRGRDVKLNVLNKKHVAEFTFKKSIKEFNELLITLGLNPKRYEKYIKMNYVERIKHGSLN